MHKSRDCPRRHRVDQSTLSLSLSVSVTNLVPPALEREKYVVLSQLAQHPVHMLRSLVVVAKRRIQFDAFCLFLVPYDEHLGIFEQLLEYVGPNDAHL